MNIHYDINILITKHLLLQCKAVEVRYDTRGVFGTLMTLILILCIISSYLYIYCYLQ